MPSRVCGFLVKRNRDVEEACIACRWAKQWQSPCLSGGSAQLSDFGVGLIVRHMLIAACKSVT